MADINTGNMSPEEYAQQQALTRQQQMATLLMQQGQQQPQGQMVSGRYVPTSFFQNLVPVANIAASKYVGEKADTEQAKLAQQIRQNKAAAEESILNKMTGTPAQATEMAGPYTGNVPMPVAVQPGTKPDLAAALREIRTNQYGAGKDYTPTILKQMMPDVPTSVTEFNYAKANPEYANFDIGRRQAGATKLGLEIQNQLPFKQQIQKGAADTLIKNFETLQNIPSTLQNMDKMVELSKQPMFAGVGAEAKLNAAKLLNNNFGTNISPEAVKNTEEFKSAAYMGILENLKKTDANPTMQQQNALKEALGNIGTDPTAIPAVIGVYRDVLVNKAQQHNRQVKETQAKGVEYPFDISIGLPEPKAQGGANVRSQADAILNRKPGAPQ